MRILADAHVSRAILEFLRQVGHDCLHAELIAPGMPDEALLELAHREQRVILTADKDFGELVYRRGIRASGVILLRLRAISEAQRVALLQTHWAAIERSATGHFVVVTNRRVRRSPLPEAS